VWLLRILSSLLLVISSCCAFAQTVAPVIVEYKGKAEGRISLVNNTTLPMAVVLQPQSFSITPEGKGVYRPLDPDIHVKLSAMSFRIDPGQTYYVFYSATADKLPAWFTVYSVFSSAQHRPGLDVRILLPHTVYIYPKKSKGKENVQLTKAVYVSKSRKILCDLENNTPDLARVQEMRITGAEKVSASAAGFPLLPGGHRHVEVAWDESEPPKVVVLELEHSTIKQNISTSDQ
jgi:P pilus assembly chaperone PapD